MYGQDAVGAMLNITLGNHQVCFGYYHGFSSAEKMKMKISAPPFG